MCLVDIYVMVKNQYTGQYPGFHDMMPMLLFSTKSVGETMFQAKKLNKTTNSMCPVASVPIAESVSRK